jgi:hypothetical protein
MRNGNEKLMNYFKRDRLKDLINFIIEMPTEDEHNRGHKFPFLVNEIFSLDNSKINEKFFSVEEEEPEEKPTIKKAEDDIDSSSEDWTKPEDDLTKSSDEEENEEEEESK